jgi:hypothetical protein
LISLTILYQPQRFFSVEWNEKMVMEYALEGVGVKVVMVCFRILTLALSWRG